MGFLTDPNNSTSKKITRTVVKNYRKLCAALFCGGLVWLFGFCVVSSETPYFSDKAFLAGLANREIENQHESIVSLHEELLGEIDRAGNRTPYAWIERKFQETGLETYAHNFTINHPLGLDDAQKTSGRNIYSILRTPRGHSNEALVLSAPFRAAPAALTTTPSVAFIIAFAEFAKSRNYWSKDVIFLITEHEEGGAQAWLEAYHEVCLGLPGVVQADPLPRRSGFILAAINLELHSSKISHVDVKIEGLNGRLPNLDIFDASVKMLEKHNVPRTFKNRKHEFYHDVDKLWWDYVQTLTAMILTQASGISNGIHGVFLSFGIHSLTLEGHASGSWTGSGFKEMGRAVEAVLRSLNNVVQRFHQSFFFYLLTSARRFVPIGMYIPSMAMMVGAVFVKALARWAQLQTESEPINPLPIFSLVAGLHLLGVLIMNSPKFIAAALASNIHSLDACLFSVFAGVSVTTLLIPKLVPQPLKSCKRSMTVLNILALLELGVVLLALSVPNFSLALCTSILFVPGALSIGLKRSRLCNFLLKLVWLAVHPLVALCAIVAAFRYMQFPSLSGDEHSFIESIQKAFVSTIFSNIIYGHWLFALFTAVFIPNWLCFWVLLFAEIDQSSTKLKLHSN